MLKEKEKFIEIKGARVNNLKSISLNIPRNCLVAISGVSGSGKSSLAFDTLYAEGQRRYVESLSSYARQFLGQARVRFHQRSATSHRHRAEGGKPKSTLYRRHFNGDLRVSPTSLCPSRSYLLTYQQ